jgi:outer membrane lipoprotein-sorting protein
VRRKPLSIRPQFWRVPLALLVCLACGCAVSHKRVVPAAQVRPALQAAAGQLVARYNQQAAAVRSLNAAVQLTPVAGSAYSGVIEEYHQVSGFVLAEKPAWIRVIGQAPVVAKDIFDMASDGTTFRIYIPSKNKFLVGRNALERPAKKPIENLRPQHLLEAFFWPEIAPGEPVLFEESEEAAGRQYILTVLRKSAEGLEPARKIWFDRADLSIARVEIYGPGGRLDSDIGYADWQALGDLSFPHEITLRRPHDDYQLGIRITRLALNQPIAASRFELAQPPGTELVRVGESAPEAQP